MSIHADPAVVRVKGPGTVYSLLVHGKTADGDVVDLTRDADYTSGMPALATVSARGIVRGLKDGTTQIEISAAGKTAKVEVIVEGMATPRRPNFANDVVPLFSRFGCNSSGCHGKAEGQNGFKLSVFGFDPAADYAALTRESRGRRLMLTAPEHSLLLRKISGQVAHGGGIRIPSGSDDFETLRSWIAAGAPFGDPTDPRVEKIRIDPSERTLAMRGRQQLRVVATFSDDHEEDVSRLARFQSNNEALATVNSSGLVTSEDVPGDVAVMASYMGCVQTFRAFVPRSQKIANYPALAENNFIDKLVFGKLRNLNILPSEPADDSEYLRRVYLDVIGTLPTADEARRFLADKSADKRSGLVAQLLRRPEYADYWALKWSDLLRVDRQALGHKRAFAYYQWIHDSMEANKPIDRFARELLVAEGPLSEAAAGSFYKAVTKPGEMASTISQVFLGVRIACAECHHHPFDRWSQDDYFGMQAFFTAVSFRDTPQGSALLGDGAAAVTRNPRSGVEIQAHALGMPMPQTSRPGDRRPALADWLTSPDNAWFARNIANRVWAHFMGRGLVEPVDDVRATNPPTNPELLDALARYLVENKFDVQKLIVLITASRVYQLSSLPNETNEKDEQNYSRASFKRVDAEVLLDMICQASGVPEKFEGAPESGRAIQLWDSSVQHHFLKLFGRPARVSVCECERNHEPGVAQVLHFMNSPELNGKLSHERGTVARLLRDKTDDASLVEELYLTFYSRYPTDREREKSLKYLRKDPAKRRQAAEDLAWTLLNSLEFSFNH